MSKKLKPITPGEILLKEFMEPLAISQNKLARDLDVPVGRISDIVRGKRIISIDTALRLAIYFRTTPEFWINLQGRYDLKIAREELLPIIHKNIRPLPRAA
jgi:addiction module HigA family antidote